MEFAYGAIGFLLGLGLTAGFFLLMKKPTALATSSVSPSSPPPPAAPPKPTADAIRFLALLQSEARFFDFLMEDLSNIDDPTVGKAVKEIHKKTKATIEQHLVLEQILPQLEGSSVTVPVGFDPSRIRVLGNVTGQPPFTGTLNHPGWRVREIKLAPPATGTDVFVIQPAEVQVA
jgi:hypothetical protein